jgi:prepilin-type N-terminal cleavage/methylation domain-containing protein
MRYTGRDERGVTLLELLIAVTLVSLLSVGILYAMRIGLVTLERTNERVLANRRVLGAERILDQQVANMMVVKTVCNGPRDDMGNGMMPFFQGEPAQMRFVTSYSIGAAGRGFPQVVEFALIPGEKNRGVRLVVNERPYTGPASIDFLCRGIGTDPATGQPAGQFLPVELGLAPFVIADRLASSRIAYQIADPRTRKKVWTSHFTGVLPPAAIRIEMVPIESDPGKLSMSTLLLPVRVYRNSRLAYRDIDEQDAVFE